MRKLYKFSADCGRMGYIEGTLIEDDDLVAKCIGQKVYFGEILGKHSDIRWDLKESDLVVLTDDQQFIEKAIKFGLAPMGHSPIEKIYERMLDQGISAEDEAAIAILRAAGIEEADILALTEE